MPKMTIEELIAEGIERRRLRMLGEQIKGIVKSQAKVEKFTKEFFEGIALPQFDQMTDAETEALAAMISAELGLEEDDQ